MSEVDLDSREYFLNCIVTTALEGGIGYWAVAHTYKPSDMGDGYAIIQQFDEETGKQFGNQFRLDCAAVEEGIRRILYGDVKIGKHTVSAVAWANANNDAGDIDADYADTITQATMLGEIVYG